MASYRSVRTRGPAHPGEGKENLAYRKAAKRRPRQTGPTTDARELRIVVDRRDRHRPFEASSEGRDALGHDERPASALHRQPSDDGAGRSPVCGHRSQHGRQGDGRTSANARAGNGRRSISPRAPRRCVRRRPRRPRQTTVPPPFRGHADMSEAERHLIAGARRGSREQQRR